MNRGNELTPKDNSGEAHEGHDHKPYIGKDKDAQKLAELGTLALIGKEGTNLSMMTEIHKLEQNPQHLKKIATDLVNINLTKGGVPVHASVETDNLGNVSSLKFHSSKDLEKIASGDEHKYSPDITVNAAPAIHPSHEFTVLNSTEQKTLAALKAAVQTGDENALQAAVKPYLKQDFHTFRRIADTDEQTTQFTYTIDGNKLESVLYHKPNGRYLVIM